MLQRRWLPRASGLVWQAPGAGGLPSLRRAGVEQSKSQRALRLRRVTLHIRARSCGDADIKWSEENCHPFRYGPLLFQHNGHVEGFSKIKRRIMNALPEDLYNFVEGTTDSEACFALLLSLLDRDTLASGRVPPAEMQSATLGTIALLRDFLESEQIDTGYSTFNFALTDGHSVVVTRFCDKAPKIPPPSLYYAFLPEDAPWIASRRRRELFWPTRPGVWHVDEREPTHARCQGRGGPNGQRLSQRRRRVGRELRSGCVCLRVRTAHQVARAHLAFDRGEPMICFSLDDPRAPR